ncbi:MAG TPA: DUF4136 domain-containing protein [Vicinamibacterales bacterium]|nr:DUF4136 domain-containing protein [Vicinamibacterales bacterium]
MSAAAALHAAKVKVEARPDPTFDFGRVQSWAWDADGGEVIMARTAHDDPAPVKARIDPLIRKYVDEAMTKQGLTQATGSTPDLQLHYYVLVTIASEGQTMGQFLPAVPYWGLPAFNPGTSALSVVTRGSLVLDAMIPGTVGDRKVVWRGIAQSTVEDADSDRVRDERIHKAVQELIKRLPRKKK